MCLPLIHEHLANRRMLLAPRLLAFQYSVGIKSYQWALFRPLRPKQSHRTLLDCRIQVKYNQETDVTKFSALVEITYPLMYKDRSICDKRPLTFEISQIQQQVDLDFACSMIQLCMASGQYSNHKQ